MRPTLLGLRRPIYLICIVTGLAYGLTARLVFGLSALQDFAKVMSATFIFFVPIAVGFLSVFFSPQEEGKKFGRWIVLPWAASLLTLASALALLWEGLICVIVWAPLFMVLSSIGGLIAGITRRIDKSWSKTTALASITLLPFLLAPLEQRLPPSIQYRVAETEIVIDRGPEVVWRHIREVAPIRDEELEGSFSHAIGFPKPIAATLSGEGIGAVRHATFEGGVLFVETVTEWKPMERLSFTIEPDPHIPPTTFDEHVVVGGDYFDVLSGTYRIERLGPNRCRLHLSSRQRLSTHFNAYTQIWTDFFMKDIQNTILRVIKKRCENTR